MDFMSDKLMPIAMKVGTQKHFSCIKGFIHCNYACSYDRINRFID